MLQELVNNQAFNQKIAKTQFTITEQKHQKVFNQCSKLKKLIKKVEEEIFCLRQQIQQDYDGKFYKLQKTGCRYFWAQFDENRDKKFDLVSRNKLWLRHKIDPVFRDYEKTRSVIQYRLGFSLRYLTSYMKEFSMFTLTQDNFDV